MRRSERDKCRADKIVLTHGVAHAQWKYPTVTIDHRYGIYQTVKKSFATVASLVAHEV